MARGRVKDKKRMILKTIAEMTSSVMQLSVRLSKRKR